MTLRLSSLPRCLARIMHVAIAVTIALPLLACGGEEPRRRVILIGIDGASPLVAFPMMEEGRLPHLAAIARDGVHGPLRSVLPLYSPRIWNTIATGRPAGQHGVTAFVKPSTDARKKLFFSSDRKVPALWNILSAQGFTTGVVNWWTTYPPERIEGVMVSDHFFPEQISMIKRTFKDERSSSGTLVHPESWQARAESLRAESGPPTRIENPFAEHDGALLPHWVNREILSGQFETDASVTRIALGLQEDLHPDVMMVFLPGIDRVSHWLWGNLEPAEKYPASLQPSESERAAGAETLRLYYEFSDELIGLLTEDYGPDDLVMVISDHGFEAGESLMLLTGVHDTPAALDGILYARGHGIEAGRAVGPISVYDVAPSLLAWLGVPPAANMPGHPAAFLGIDPPLRVASYDDLPIQRAPEAASGREDEIVEHLRSLGYLEADDAAATGAESDSRPDGR